MTKAKAEQILAGITGGDELEAAKVAGDTRRADVLAALAALRWITTDLSAELHLARRDWESRKALKKTKAALKPHL